MNRGKFILTALVFYPFYTFANKIKIMVANSIKGFLDHDMKVVGPPLKVL